MRAYATAMSKYAVFRGRASRAEFWGFMLVYLGIALAVVILDQSLVPLNAPGSGLLTSIFSLVHILPGMGVLIRRMHDIDRTGWWVLINVTGIGFFVLLIMAALRGTEGPNRHGPEPYGTRRLSGGAASPYVAPLDGQQGYAVAPALPDGSTRPVAGRDTIADLERLAKLHADGGLTDEEYQAMKARTLNA